MIRVLIADDQELVRAGFRLILDAADGIEVVGEADNGRDAVTRALHLRPDVCLLDIRMPELDGIAACRELAGKDVEDPLNVVMITTLDMDEYVYGSIDAGAVGFLLKNAAPELLIEAVRAAAQRESLISPSVTTRLLENASRRGMLATAENESSVDLSDREEEVLVLVATGKTNAEIAQELNVSFSTAKAHVANLLTKLGARNRVEIAIWAYQTGRVEV